MTNEITTSNNLAYRNSIAEDVSVVVSKNLNKSGDYEIGEQLLCKLYLKTTGHIKYRQSDDSKTIKTYKCNKNVSYEIVEVSDKTITIKDTVYDVVQNNELELNELQYEIIKTKDNHTVISNDVFITLPINVVKKHFAYNYCRTGHSLQGVTINDEMTIFDYKLPFVNRKWLWVAISRATSLDKVKFFHGECDTFNEQLVERYFKGKISNYMEQDKKAKREINKDNYITVNWLKDNLGKCCRECKSAFNISIRNCSVISDLTANRKDNDIGHELENIEPLCITCNASLSNKTDND